MGIEVTTESVSTVGDQYRQVGAALASNSDGFRSGVDAAAAAVVDAQVVAGLSRFQDVVGGALRTLAERTDRYGGKVAGAAATYRSTDDEVGEAASAAASTLPDAGGATAPEPLVAGLPESPAGASPA